MDVAEETDKDTDEDASPSTQTNIGVLLAEARENKNLTAQDIADQMNLRLSIITKIEVNDFDQDIPRAFIRGYIRSYAQKVGVDVETICVEFDRQTNSGNESLQSIKIVSGYKIKRKEINSSSSTFKLITFAIVASIVIFASWELYKRFIKVGNESESQFNTIKLSTTEKKDAVNQTNVSSEVISATRDENITEPGDALLPTVVKANDISAPDVSLISEKTSIPPQTISGSTLDRASGVQHSNIVQNNTTAETGNLSSSMATSVLENSVIEKKSGPVASLDFEFNGDCWVEVTDANGEVLAIGMKRKGKIMPLTGVTPITVILGEPSAATVEFQGAPYDLSHFGAGRRARFVVE